MCFERKRKSCSRFAIRNPPTLSHKWYSSQSNKLVTQSNFLKVDSRFSYHYQSSYRMICLYSNDLHIITFTAYNCTLGGSLLLVWAALWFSGEYFSVVSYNFIYLCIHCLSSLYNTCTDWEISRVINLILIIRHRTGIFVNRFKFHFR